MTTSISKAIRKGLPTTSKQCATDHKLTIMNKDVTQEHVRISIRVSKQDSYLELSG